MNQALNTSFRGRAPTPAELDDRILIELAIRDQANLDEKRRPLPQLRAVPEFTDSVREIAAAEGWMVSVSAVDAAVQRLTKAVHLDDHLRRGKLSRRLACPDNVEPLVDRKVVFGGAAPLPH